MTGRRGNGLTASRRPQGNSLPARHFDSPKRELPAAHRQVRTAPTACPRAVITLKSEAVLGRWPDSSRSSGLDQASNPVLLPRSRTPIRDRTTASRHTMGIDKCIDSCPAERTLPELFPLEKKMRTRDLPFPLLGPPAGDSVSLPGKPADEGSKLCTGRGLQAGEGQRGYSRRLGLASSSISRGNCAQNMRARTPHFRA